MIRALPLPLSLALSLLVMAGCDSGDDPVDGGGMGLDGSRADGGPGRVDGGGDCVPGEGETFRECVVSLPVDMVWVIDNSHSMRVEQENVIANFPVLIDTLTNPPDRDGDGSPDFPPLTDLRIGIVSTDFGVGPNHPVIGCDATGDEGRFITESRSERAECDGVELGDTPWIEYEAGDDLEELSRTFGCLAELGIDGCGAEQQLEVSYQAVIEHTRPGGFHEGFLRPDSLVVIVYLTDEDDCSFTDPDLFDNTVSGRETYGPLPVRCENNPEALQPLSRYIEAFQLLSFERRGGVLLAAITGAPRDLAGTRVMDPDFDALCLDFDGLLDDERMQTRVVEETDPFGMTRYSVAPACQFGGVAEAEPARRVIGVIEPFGRRRSGLVLSICEPDLSPAMRTIAELVSSRLCDLR